MRETSWFASFLRYKQWHAVLNSVPMWIRGNGRGIQTPSVEPNLRDASPTRSRPPFTSDLSTRREYIFLRWRKVM